jgi:choline dehydrogenase-like flavoprotein
MYDDVMVGGGSAGGVLAARLPELRDLQVLLLEAGPRGTGATCSSSHSLFRLPDCVRLWTSDVSDAPPIGPDSCAEPYDLDRHMHAIAGLRQYDSSIMPDVVCSKTNAPTIAIAEKAADVLRGNR